MTRRLYELVMADGALISPYAWRTRYALAYKGLDFETTPVGFTKIPEAAGGGFKTVPILEDGERKVCDSWAIADYLDAAYPDRPALFTSPRERAMAVFFEKWLISQLFFPLIRVCVLDIHNRVQPEDLAYFRTSREARFGGTLEDLTRGREEHLKAFRGALQPMRLTLAATPFLGGQEVSYADFIALGGFIWAGAVSTLPLLEADDPLREWLDRGLDLYGGAGRIQPLPALAA